MLHSHWNNTFIYLSISFYVIGASAAVDSFFNLAIACVVWFVYKSRCRRSFGVLASSRCVYICISFEFSVKKKDLDCFFSQVQLLQILDID